MAAVLPLSIVPYTIDNANREPQAPCLQKKIGRTAQFSFHLFS
jgi:hypothetical protein